jgi:uncharacterized protein (UPF0335 family)
MKQSPRERLVYQVQTLERLEAEKKEASDALRQAFDEAKRAGFDPSTLKVVLRLRKLTPEQRKERRALEAIYLAALGMLEGDPLPEEARRRLDEEPAPDQPKKGTEGRSSPREAPAPAPAPRPQQQPMNLKDPEEARKEGRAAAGTGKRIYDNPYTAGDPCRAAWDEGWCESKKSNGMDTPAAYQRRSQPPEKSDKEEKGAA